MWQLTFLPLLGATSARLLAHFRFNFCSSLFFSETTLCHSRCDSGRAAGVFAHESVLSWACSWQDSPRLTVSSP